MSIGKKGKWLKITVLKSQNSFEITVSYDEMR